jgi:pectate lyase
VELQSVVPARTRRYRHHLLAWVLGIGIGVTPAAALAGLCENSGVPGTPYEGFGAGTTGGAGQKIVPVTSLADSGPGTLREALSTGNRCVVFDVAGDIVLKKQLYVGGKSVTVDGFSAPAPGITLRDFGLSIWGSHGAENVVVRGLRFRNAGQKTCSQGSCWDAIQIKNGARRVVIDHVSSDHASDGGLDISSQSTPLTRDVTVQWSIFSGTRNQSLLQRATRISVHHNLFIDGHNRNPQVDWGDATPPETALDFRNNVVWNFSGYGTLVRGRATANVIGNYYYSPSRPAAHHALVVDGRGRAHASGNRSGDGADVDESGTESGRFAAPSVSVTDACQAAEEVQAEAGARARNFGLDVIDRHYIGDLASARLPGCAGSSPVARPSPVSSPGSAATADLVLTSVSLPGTLQRSQGFPVKFGITNRGAGPAAGSRVKIYLSTDTRFSSGDVLLRNRYIGPIAPSASQWHSLTEVIPAGVRSGSYYVLLVSDAEGVVRESNEGNNVRAVAVVVR